MSVALDEATKAKQEAVETLLFAARRVGASVEASLLRGWIDHGHLCDALLAFRSSEATYWAALERWNTAAAKEPRA